MNGSYLTSKERILAAVNHCAPDRTPITFDAEKEVYDLLYGRLNATSKEELFDKLHVDTWMILPGNFIFPRSERDGDCMSRTRLTT